MAAISQYPVKGQKIVRGDPLTIPVRIKLDDGTPVDVSDWMWRAQIRRSYDGTHLDDFTISVDTPEDETVPCRVLLDLSAEQTTRLKEGYVFDLEQLEAAATPTITVRTWWIVTKLLVQKDVSHE
jgi:hypothetical protein